jgi:MFS family permease
VTRLRGAGRQTFRSLTHRNFRIYLAGQIVSGSGSWMQQVAQVWLVLKLTDSGIALGITTALQFLPVLLGGAWAGVVADRMDKRKLLIFTSATAGVLAATLGLLTALDVVQLWMVYVLAMSLGAVTALDSPARRSFVTELVPEEHEANAVSLNSSVFTAARIIGPALAGLVIAAFGIPVCFFLNSVSFIAVIFAMLMLHQSEIRPARRMIREKGQLVAGLQYAWSIPALRTTLLMTAVIGTLSFNFQVTLSLMAKKTFGGDAGTFGLLYALMSGGALVGSLVVAHREKATSRFVVLSALLFGVFMLVASAAPTLPTMALVLVPMGAASIAFLSSAGALSQTRADPTYRGRVAALFAVAFLGSTPIGGPIVGAVSQVFGARSGLVLGGIAALTTASLVAVRSRAGVRWTADRSRLREHRISGPRNAPSPSPNF